jgi:lipoyl(octanoyl) transferase
VTSAPARLSDPATRAVIVRDLGCADYARVWQNMQTFTEQRDPSTRDEIWLVEHPPVYTLGTNDRNEAFDNPGIPVVKSDRGGQITYHGPGQLVAYVLMDLRRRGWGVKQLVTALEQAVIRRIKPCGFAGLETTDLALLTGHGRTNLAGVKTELLAGLSRNLGYNDDQVT